MDGHLGQWLKEKAIESGMIISKIATKMEVSRGQLYRLFREEKLEKVKPRYILSLGHAIHYDFTKDFPELKKEALKFEAQESSFTYRKEHKEQLLKLYKKYTKLLEAYNQLLNFLIGLVRQGKLSEKEIKHLLEREIDLYNPDEN